MWSLKCFHCDYGTVSQCDPTKGNRSTELTCTPTSNRCFRKVIKSIDSKDKIEQGCTNEAGCNINERSCNDSGDCSSYCCEENFCNNGAGSISNKALLLVPLMIAINTGFPLLIWQHSEPRITCNLKQRLLVFKDVSLLEINKSQSLPQ